MPTRIVPQISGRVVNSLDDITVRDHLKAKQHDESKSSEFLTAAVGVPTPELMAVIDQHMEAIKVVYPSEYNAIVAKIRSLHEAT